MSDTPRSGNARRALTRRWRRNESSLRSLHTRGIHFRVASERHHGYPMPKSIRGNVTMSRALGIFKRQQVHVEQLIEIHKASDRRPNGTPRDCSALRHAGVVFCVAYWGAYVTNVVKEIYGEVDLLLKNPDNKVTLLNKSIFDLNKENLDRRRFNTPNSNNVIKYFKGALKFDPTKNWSIEEKTDGKWNKEQRNIPDRIDFWLGVRHAIAHGFDLPYDTRDKSAKNKIFNLNYRSFIECRDFFNFLVHMTDEDLNNYVRDKFDIMLKDS